MRALGCLTLIVLIGVGIYLLSNSEDMTEQDKAHAVGRKAHRGWSKVKEFARGVHQGWQSSEDQAADAAQE